MYKPFLALLFFTISLFARQELFPSQECPAFNNMKHTKNTHQVVLDTTKKYTIIREYKGQKLLLIKGEQPAQRWVDKACFSKKINPANVAAVKSDVVGIESTNKYHDKKFSRQNLLALSWHNAFCETHRYRKECKRSLFPFGKTKYKEKHFVLHGLWPQPKNKTYCEVSPQHIALDKHKQWNRLPSLGLNNKVKKDLQKVMPGFFSNLHKHEWIKHGTCYGTDANRYYTQAVSMVEQLNDSKVGDFFTKHIGKEVTLQHLRLLFDRNFGAGTGKRVELRCKKGLVTELWLHLGSYSDDLGTLLKRGKQTRSRCQKGYIDKAGF